MTPTDTKIKPQAADLPGFLKLAFIVTAGAPLAYMLFSMNGGTGLPGRGPLVQALNVAATASAGLIYVVTAAIVILGVVMVAFSFGKSGK
jgi:hypothetical protein